MKNKANKENYSKLNEEETNNVVTKEPNRITSMDKIEVLSSQIVNSPLVKKRYANCFSRFKNWACFFGRTVEDNYVDPLLVYQPTTTTIK